MEPRQAYPTDLTDREWALIQPDVPQAKPGGRPETYPKRDVLDAICSILRGGRAWRLLPHDFPPWPIVYPYVGRWRHDGPWQLIYDRLRGDVRGAIGKRRQPRAASIDGQSVQTTEKGGARRRCRHTGEGAHTASPRRYPRTAPHGGRDRRQCAGPRRGEAGPGAPAARLYTAAAHLG